MPGLLTLAITSPIIGAIVLMLIPNRDGSKDGLIRYLALGVSLVTFAITLALWAGFDAATAEQDGDRHEGQRHENWDDKVHSVRGVVVPSALAEYSSFTTIVSRRPVGSTI